MYIISTNWLVRYGDKPYIKGTHPTIHNAGDKIGLQTLQTPTDICRNYRNATPVSSKRKQHTDDCFVLSKAIQETMEDDSSCSKLQLCLTWNSFTDNIVSSLESSYGDGDFVDVTLACEGESIKAHKLVLSACSQYLKRLLKENPCPHPIIILKDVGLAELKDLLVYMYHGEVRVEQERIAKLLHTAQILEIRGLRDINQKLDQELDSGINETSSLITAASEGPQNQDTSATDEYIDSQQSRVSNNTVAVQRKSLSTSSKKTTVYARSVMKSSVGRKPRPIPMLQSIQQSGKMDGNAVMPMSVDRDEDEAEDESNNSSLAPDHTVFLDDVRVKEETPDISEQFEFATNQSSTLDENSSDTDQHGFNNGYANPSMVLTLGGGSSLGGGLLAAQMLKRVATRASSSEAVSVVKEAASVGNMVVKNSSVADQAGSVTKTQEDSRTDEVTVSLFNDGSQRWRTSYNATAQSSSSLETDKQSQLMGLKPWEILKLANRTDDRQQAPLSSDLSSGKSHENVTENMDLDSSQFWRKNSFHQTSHQQAYRNSKQVADQFVRPGECVQKERKTSLRFQAIEHMLNITPQLRLQMLMCREYKKYTNILLVAMFGREMLATHSLNGTGTSKPRLDIQKVNQVIDAVMARFGVDQNHVKEAIRIKLNNEDKLKKRLTQKVSSGLGSL